MGLRPEKLGGAAERGGARAAGDPSDQLLFMGTARGLGGELVTRQTVGSRELFIFVRLDKVQNIPMHWE